MNIIKSEHNKNQITLYPTMSGEKWNNYSFKPAVVITNSGKTSNLLHRVYGSEGWSIVQIRLTKKQMQDYIDELQKMCNELTD